MGLFSKKNDSGNKQDIEDETIDASELLALNQEAARKEKNARQALVEKESEITEEDESGIEFEATTTIKNVGELLQEIEAEEETYQSKKAVNVHISSKDHVDEVILLKEKILKMKFEQRFQNQQLRDQVFKLLSPFEKSKNPAVVKQIQKIKKLIHDFTKDKNNSSNSNNSEENPKSNQEEVA